MSGSSRSTVEVGVDGRAGRREGMADGGPAGERPGPDAPSDLPALRARDLGKRYGDHTVLDGLSLEIRGGERVAILGPNGAGKTTLFRCILGLTDFEGELRVAGHPSGPAGKEARRRIGYVPQQPPRFDLRLAEFVRGFAELRGAEVPEVATRLEELGLSLEESGKKALRDLSGGMLQKALLALALGSDPPLLLLDEPTANLDPASRREFLRALGRVDPGTTLLFASHRFDDVASLADRLVVIRGGRFVFDGSPAELWGLAGTDVDVWAQVPRARTPAAVRILEGSDRLRRVEDTGAGLELEVEAGHELEVLGALEEAGIELLDFRVRPPALEAVLERLDPGTRGAEVESREAGGSRPGTGRRARRDGSGGADASDAADRPRGTDGAGAPPAPTAEEGASPADARAEAAAPAGPPASPADARAEAAAPSAPPRAAGEPGRPARTLLRWELRDALRSYWFLVNAGVFLVGGLLLMSFGQPDVSILGYRGYARALAALVQLALVFVPLMALFPATAAIAGERELGTLDYLLAQPLTRDEAFLGKWAGVGAAMTLSLALAFGVTGGVAAVRGVPTGMVAGLLGLTLLLAATFVSFGLWISALADTRGRATSVGLTLWLGLVALGSLGMMAAFVRWGWPAWSLEGWSLVNPVEAYRLAAVSLLDADADVLGAAGAALLDRLGRPLLIGGAVASLAAWTGVAYRVGRAGFRRS